LSPLRGFYEASLDGLEAVDGVRVAVEHLEQQVSSQSVQASGPPFDPFIYRTSPATFHSRRYCVLFVFEKISLLRQNLFHCRVRFHPLQEKNAFPAAWSAGERAAERRNERGLATALGPVPSSAGDGVGRDACGPAVSTCNRPASGKISEEVMRSVSPTFIGCRLPLAD